MVERRRGPKLTSLHGVPHKRCQGIQPRAGRAGGRSPTRSASLTVAGTTTSPATNVTVNSLTADRYADNTFSRTNLTLVSGNNTFTAAGKDNFGRQDSQSITANLPTTVTYTYDGNGNLTYDGNRAFDY